MYYCLVESFVYFEGIVCRRQKRKQILPPERCPEMKKGTTFVSAVIGIMAAITICSKDNGNVIIAAETEKVKFECELEIPEDFDSLHFYIPKVNGIQAIDTGKAYEKYVKDKDIQETYSYSTKDKYFDPEGKAPEENVYILSDGTVIDIDAGFYLWKNEKSIYANALRMNERGASHEEFPFKTPGQCIEEVKSTLSEIEYPVDEFKFSWFSMNAEEYEKLEQEYVDSGFMEPEKIKDAWTEADNTYEIYAWQTYGGLPVFPQMMTTRMGRAFEGYQNAPLSATFTEKGMLFLSAQTSYDFEETDEQAVFLDFSEIASKVKEKYDNLLDSAVYKVVRAKLAVRVFYDEKQRYGAEPVWYFEVMDDNGSMSVVLMNALTGKEIYLN